MPLPKSLPPGGRDLNQQHNLFYPLLSWEKGARGKRQ